MSMRSLFHTPQNHLSPPKPPNTTFQTTTINNPQFGYEPTSVLEQHRSPSPVSNYPVVTGVQGEWDEHAIVLPPSSTNPPLSLDDWDSMMLGLPEKDDSSLLFKNINAPQFQLPPFELEPPPQIPTPSLQPFHSNNLSSSPPLMLEDFNFNFNDLNVSNSSDLYQVEQSNSNSNSNVEFDCSQLEHLIKAATFVESNDTPSARVILARLNQPLRYPAGKPLQRSAYYFKEALQFFVNGSSLSELGLSPLEIVQKIKAYKAFSEISPVTMFANCTANQTLLDALDGAIFIHIVDFEIGLGGQWASFMQEIASKAKARGVLPASLRITAVISEEEASIEGRLIRDNLGQFAFELGIQFQLDYVLFSVFESLSFNSVRFSTGELIAMNLSPAIFRRLKTIDAVSNFLRFVRKIAPRITLFIDFEGCSRDARGSSFRRNFVNGLEFYSSLFESLDAATSGDAELARRVETFLLRQKIFASVFAAATCNLPWREIISSVGLVPVQFSEFTDSQAEWLVRRAQVRGFHVAKQHGSMLLYWRERELVATSAWRC